MPTYVVTDSRTGVKLRLTGDSPPTDQELEQIFAQHAPAQTKYDPTEGMSGMEKFAAGYGGVIPKMLTGLKQGATEITNAAQGLPTAAGMIPGVGGAIDLIKGGGKLLGVDDQMVARQRAAVDEQKRLDKPLLETGAGKAGDITGNIAAAIPTAFIPGGNTYTGAGLLGGFFGAEQPVGTNDSRTTNAAVGAGTGVAVQGIGRLLGAGYQAGKAYLAPLFKKGQEDIVARTLERFSANPQALLAGGEESAIPGVQRTLAETTLDPGIAGLQLAVKNSDPIAKSQLLAQELKNQGVRLSALNDIAQTPAAREAAVLARKQATTPLYNQVAQSGAEANPSRVVNLIDRMTEANPANKALTKPLSEIRESLFQEYPAEQRGADAWKHLNDAINAKALPQREWNALVAARKVMDRVRKGSIDATEALAQLQSLKGATTATNDSLNFVRSQMKTPDYVLMQEPRQLKSAMDNIKAMLGNQDNAFVKRELTTIKNALGHQISKVEPAYGQAERTFAEMSGPINQMDVGRQLYEKLVPALTENSEIPTRVTAQQYANALRNAEQTVKSATGMNRSIEKIMSPEQMTTLKNIASDLARKASADDLAKTVGSTTSQNLAAQNLMRQTMGPLGVPSGWMEGEVLPNVAQALLAPYKLTGADKAINQRLAEALMNPKQAQELLKRLPAADQGKLAEILSRAAVPAGILSRPNTSQ